ncbi:MAG: hypothetical protein COY04_01465, partial [Parcubacteria group bacterium CG_4_10_14_0_2_um_filter_7_35_8]
FENKKPIIIRKKSKKIKKRFFLVFSFLKSKISLTNKIDFLIVSRKLNISDILSVIKEKFKAGMLTGFLRLNFNLWIFGNEIFFKKLNSGKNLLNDFKEKSLNKG